MRVISNLIFLENQVRSYEKFISSLKEMMYTQENQEQSTESTIKGVFVSLGQMYNDLSIILQMHNKLRRPDLLKRLPENELSE
jgi:CII-binding regulator of phage lambda lysogenization HflD